MTSNTNTFTFLFVFRDMEWFVFVKKTRLLTFVFSANALRAERFFDIILCNVFDEKPRDMFFVKKKKKNRKILFLQYSKRLICKISAWTDRFTFFIKFNIDCKSIFYWIIYLSNKPNNKIFISKMNIII